MSTIDMTVLNHLVLFLLVTDSVDHVPLTGGKGVRGKTHLMGKLCKHDVDSREHGLDMPKVGCWKLEPPHE